MRRKGPSKSAGTKTRGKANFQVKGTDDQYARVVLKQGRWLKVLGEEGDGRKGLFLETFEKRGKRGGG